MEHFYTIQGEGFHQGKAAYFVRLAGCDIGCHWCDVKESWDISIHPNTQITSIINEIKKTPCKIVVITGGEPLQHNLFPLTKLLKESDYQIHIETSGAFPSTGDFDWFCLSPKKIKEPEPNCLKIANELKIIIYNKSDFTFAEKYAKLVPENCKLYLQPEWSTITKTLPTIIEYIKSNPKWQISLQSHKYMNIP